MSHPNNFLRMYRKKSPLTQGDIAFLFEVKDYTNISRYEKGSRNASIEVLIIYHFLFSVSIEKFYELQADVMLPKLLTRLELLIKEIKNEKESKINNYRIKYLEEVITRLINQI